jgi:hypothetical protein
MLLTAQIWDAQKLELAGRVGATSRRIASKVVEVLAITHEAPILDRFAQAKHGIRFTPNSDRESKFSQFMPALPPEADTCSATRDVRFGPIADITTAYSITFVGAT